MMVPPKGGWHCQRNRALDCTENKWKLLILFSVQTTMSWLNLHIVRFSRKLLRLSMCRDFVPLLGLLPHNEPHIPEELKEGPKTRAQTRAQTVGTVGVFEKVVSPLLSWRKVEWLCNPLIYQGKLKCLYNQGL